MSESKSRDTRPSVQDVALVVGGVPESAPSCARLFAENGMRVGIAARNSDKAVMLNLEKTHGVRRYACDASEPASVEQLFQHVVRDLWSPTLVVYNIDGREFSARALSKPIQARHSTRCEPQSSRFYRVVCVAYFHSKSLRQKILIVAELDSGTVLEAPTVVGGLDDVAMMSETCLACAHGRCERRERRPQIESFRDGLAHGR